MDPERVRVTPELARAWLERNDTNRPLSKTTIDVLAKDIARGNWQLTHQGIAFDEEGKLLDGQHRLWAVVRTGATVEMLVFRGVPRSTFTVLDTGRRRTGKDALSLAGESNAMHLASALRGLHLYQLIPESRWSGTGSMVSNEDLVELLDLNPRMRDAIPRGLAINRSIKMTVTAAAIGWYVTSEARPDIDLDPWFEGVITGADLKIGDPRLTLRNTMLGMGSNKSTRKRDDSRTHLFYYIKAWNTWAEGREQKLLRRSPNEPMPKPTMKPPKKSQKEPRTLYGDDD